MTSVKHAMDYDSSSGSDQCKNTSKKTTKYLKKKKRLQQTKDPQATNIITDHDDEPIELLKTPGWKELSGDLSKTNDQFTYDKMCNQLRAVQKQTGDTSLLTYLKRMLGSVEGKEGDYVLVSVIKGYRAAAWMTGNPKASHKEVKALARSLPTYSIANWNIVCSVLLYNLFMYYVSKNKLGNAYKCLQDAMMNVQTEMPNSFTSRVYDIHARMFDILAQQYQKSGKRYRNVAMRSYRLARAHHLNQHIDDERNYLLQPLWYTMDIVHIILDVPTLNTTNTFRNSHIVFKRGIVCTLNETDIKEAEEIISSIKPQVETLEPGWKIGVYERISIALIIICIRRTQLYIQSKNCSIALECIQKGDEIYKEWETNNKECSFSRYNDTPMLKVDLKSLLQTIHEQVKFHLNKTTSPLLLGKTVEECYSSHLTSNSDLCDLSFQPDSGQESVTSD